jgi:hypothetical protein
MRGLREVRAQRNRVEAHSRQARLVAGGIVLAFLLACTESPITDAPSTQTGDTGDPVVAGPATLELEIVDGGGQPGAGWQVFLVSGTLDRMGETDAQGRSTFEDVEPGSYSLHVSPPDGLAEPLVLLSFEEGEHKELLLEAPQLEPGSALGEEPQYVQVAAGLELEAALGDLQPALFDPEVEALAGARLEPFPPFDGLSAEVLAVWYLHPFDAVAPQGLPIRVTQSLGLASGEQGRVWVASYSTMSWLDAGTLVSDGTLLTGDARMPRLSTVVITRE